MEKVLSAILLINNKFQDKRVVIGSDQKLLLRTEHLGAFYKWQLAHDAISFLFREKKNTIKNFLIPRNKF